MGSVSPLLWLYRLVVAVIVLLVLVPLLIVTVTAFNASGGVVFPPENLSLRWFVELAASPDWLSSVVNSLVVAAGTTGVSMCVGVSAALGVRTLRGRSRTALIGLAVLPLFIPGLLIGITLLTFLSRFGVQQTYLALILAHSLWATPLTFSVMRATFSRFDWTIREAALDLGASPTRAFLEVVAPNVRSGLVVASLVAFVISLQEFVMALFLSGPDTRTVPVKAWNSLRQGLDPLVSVVSTVLLVVVIVFVAVVAAVAGLDRFATDT